MKEREKREIKRSRSISGMIIRYALAVLLSINSLFIFYYIFRPLTFYPVAFFLKIIYSATAFGMERIIVGIYEISFVNACIAGSAYYLLALLNLTTRGIKPADRIKIFFIDAVFLLALNITRIVVLSVFFINSFTFFNLTHLIFWNFMSVILVAAIWIFTTRFYNIKEIPVWSDIIFLKSLSG